MITFTLPAGRTAVEPPEASGVTRDRVRLMVASPSGAEHTTFNHLGAHLRPGDLVVVNTSATMPAAVDVVRPDGRAAVIHFSTELDDGTWVVEPRPPTGPGPLKDVGPHERFTLPDGTTLELLEPYRGSARLWRTWTLLTGTWLRANGRPITYDYVPERWPLADYQTVFARTGDDGRASAEMPSAGRPFTTELVLDLITRGIAVAPVTLHTGVSSLESHEPPQPERFHVPASTARLVADTHRNGGRVIAVGTTVVRALESPAGGGWTDLILGPDNPVRTVDGIITGWHEPEASHLLLLEAVAGPEVVQRAYEAAVPAGYLWHEFGDSALLLRD